MVSRQPRRPRAISSQRALVAGPGTGASTVSAFGGGGARRRPPGRRPRPACGARRPPPAASPRAPPPGRERARSSRRAAPAVARALRPRAPEPARAIVCAVEVGADESNAVASRDERPRRRPGARAAFRGPAAVEISTEQRERKRAAGGIRARGQHTQESAGSIPGGASRNAVGVVGHCAPLGPQRLHPLLQPAIEPGLARTRRRPREESRAGVATFP